MNRDHEDYGRKHHLRLLILFVLLSVGGNALHAGTDSLPAWLRVAIVTLFPLALLLATHSAVEVMRSFSGWVRIVCGSLAVCIGGFAFVLSFVALRDVAAMAGVPGGWLTVLAALIIDLMIVQSSIVVVMASRRLADQQEPAQSAHTEHCAAVAEQSPVAQTVAQPLNEGAQFVSVQPLDPVAQASEHAAQTATEHLSTPVAQSAEQPAQSADGAQLSIAQSAQSEQIEQPAQTGGDVRSLAERAHRELNPKIGVDVLSELIAAHRGGASQRQLGELAGVSPNTAARYVQEAERLVAVV
ncbi:DUF2637 domain-containing protein [Gordonia sp. 852002-50395_SCH5434458]|uniref:DUF2637 domain-containing protein n=1 Tax=Gordonia sp. 852002-50395_SCH5434458 TaxID=1834090 RepID=UPI0007EA1A39|nr:DUF2637 domain-containing protein [Gordonia sp. 852002-50395_SCH5434458]OBC01726.1 hypothetical protein A5785_17155 [Gordonia sp. 852002-50395_SCH5434458]